MTLLYLDKIKLNSRSSKEDIYLKLLKLYGPSFKETPLTINNFPLHYDESVISSKLNELIETENKIAFQHSSEKDHLIKDIFASLTIEGECASRVNIKKLLENEKQKHIAQNLETNMFSAYEYIQKNTHIVFSKKHLFDIYQILTQNIDMGNDVLEVRSQYRKDKVSIGIRDSGLEPSHISKHMNILFDFINTECGTNPIVKHLLIHLYFEIIHPFYDFNGRTGRLLVYWYSLKTGYEKEFMFFSTAINYYRPTYLKLFNETRKMKDVDATYFISGMLDILIKNKTQYLFMQKIKNKIMDEHKKELSFLAKDIILFVLSKKDQEGSSNDSWISEQVIKDNYGEYDSSVIANELNQLVGLGLVETTTTRPTKFKFLFDKFKN